MDCIRFCCSSGGFEGDVEAGAGGDGDEHFETELLPFAAGVVISDTFVPHGYETCPSYLVSVWGLVVVGRVFGGDA